MQDQVLPLPDTYSYNNDSTNLANDTWVEFFDTPELVALIDSALRHNPDLNMGLQRLEMARADVMYRRGLRMPNLSIEGWGGQARTAENSVNWAGNEGGTFISGDPLNPTYTDYYLGLQTTWEADVWGKLKNRKKAAISRFLASIEGKHLVTSNLVADIAAAYYQLVSLDHQLEAIQETIKVQEGALDIVRVQKEAGRANALAVQQFEVQLLKVKGMEREILQEINATENLINYLTGRYNTSIERNSGDLEDVFSVSLSPGQPAQLLLNRPDIKQAEKELEASKADVRAARAAFYPTIGLSAGAGYNAFKPDLLFQFPQSIAFNLFGNLSAPILNRSAIKSEFHYANAVQLEALYNYQKVILVAYTEVSTELANFENLKEQYKLKNQEVDILTNSIETSSELFKTGRASYLEVLLTQQNALEARMELIEMKQRLFQSRINMYKVLGGGWR
ncbi:RND efflux system, outer membrane lipoprotein, NodT family [Fulvivirga imtechensis AK7]|uniref:RND efflux system, outer membrane lipoprotein, NodT family n=1 Tax=Fulvivirga imtechensis AK7 TaxID=1237149 RepID=L8JPS6_9BACT|nr:RND efflux system, outer membrane lipoprotein, NodT family [Fulvivirga imtechensis AK7]